MTSVQILKLLVVSLLLVLASCSPFRAKEDPTRYYVLTAKSQGTLSSGRKLAVGVGPVTIPGYLERDEIAIAGVASSLQLAEYHVWAESLENAVTHVVAKNMSRLLQSPAVVPFPDADTRIAYQAEIIVRRFEMGADKKVHLEVSYLISRVPGSGAAQVSKSRDIVVEVANADDYNSIVDAMSGALAHLSESISRNVLSLK